MSTIRPLQPGQVASITEEAFIGPLPKFYRGVEGGLREVVWGRRKLLNIKIEGLRVLQLAGYKLEVEQQEKLKGFISDQEVERIQRSVYPLTSKQHREQFLEFYRGRVANDRGKSLREILAMTNDQLDADFRSMQWLFPFHFKGSLHNPLSLMCISEADINLSNDPLLRANFLKVIDRMLHFYGLQMHMGSESSSSSGASQVETVTITRPPDLEERRLAVFSEKKSSQNLPIVQQRQDLVASIIAFMSHVGFREHAGRMRDMIIEIGFEGIEREGLPEYCKEYMQMHFGAAARFGLPSSSSYAGREPADVVQERNNFLGRVQLFDLADGASFSDQMFVEALRGIWIENLRDVLGLTGKQTP